MNSGNKRSVAAPSTGTTASTSERLGEASEHWRLWWSRTNGELGSLDRLELLSWDEA